MVAFVSIRRSTLQILKLKKQLKSWTSVHTLLILRFHFELAALLCAGLLVLFLPVAALVNSVCSSV